MEGWRQRRHGSKEVHSTTKGNSKTDSTSTGFLMEGLGSTAASGRISKASQEPCSYGLPDGPPAALALLAYAAYGPVLRFTSHLGFQYLYRFEQISQ
jgi:hypothetical protein